MPATPQAPAMNGMTPLGLSDKPEAFDQVKPNALPGTLPKTLPDLERFIGTEHYYAHHLGFEQPRFRFTDGVKHVADVAGAYWLLDVVFSHVVDIYASKTIPEDQKRLLVCRLAVAQNNHAVFHIEDGNSNTLATQEIEFTDFPAQLQTIWVQNGVAMLPSEY